MKSWLLFAVAVTLFSAPVRSATPVPSFFAANAAKPANCANKTSNAATLAKASRPSFFGEVGVPQPVFDTGCTAEVECPGSGGTHTPLSCTGVGSCSVGTYWVTCDGTTHYCGCVGCDLCNCDCLDGGGTAIQCSRECRFDC